MKNELKSRRQFMEKKNSKKNVSRAITECNVC